jgi:hypothetical protein
VVECSRGVAGGRQQLLHPPGGPLLTALNRVIGDPTSWEGIPHLSRRHPTLPLPQDLHHSGFELAESRKARLGDSIWDCTFLGLSGQFEGSVLAD